MGSQMTQNPINGYSKECWSKHTSLSDAGRCMKVPQWVAQKRDIAVCDSKTHQLLSKKVCYEVSLCENFQRQSCSSNMSLQQVHAGKYLYMYLWSTLTLWRCLVEYSTCAMS